MPLLLEGSCHCRAIKFTLESNTPVPFQMCQCSICRKTGGCMGSVNIMGNTKSLKWIRGEGTAKTYSPALAFDKNDKPKKTTTSLRSFCPTCSSMLWNYHPEYPEWIYPSASIIDTELPTPPGPYFTILRDSCPDYVPLPKGFEVYKSYGPAGSIEKWHRDNNAWIE